MTTIHTVLESAFNRTFLEFQSLASPSPLSSASSSATVVCFLSLVDLSQERSSSMLPFTSAAVDMATSDASHQIVHTASGEASTGHTPKTGSFSRVRCNRSAQQVTTSGDTGESQSVFAAFANLLTNPHAGLNHAALDCPPNRHQDLLAWPKPLGHPCR